MHIELREGARCSGNKTILWLFPMSSDSCRGETIALFIGLLLTYAREDSGVRHPGAVLVWSVAVLDFTQQSDLSPKIMINNVSLFSSFFLSFSLLLLLPQVFFFLSLHFSLRWFPQFILTPPNLRDADNKLTRRHGSARLSWAATEENRSAGSFVSTAIGLSKRRQKTTRVV